MTFAFDSLTAYGAEVDQIHAEFGKTVDLVEVEKALSSKKYKVVTITHVDTSTGTQFCYRTTLVYSWNFHSRTHASEICQTSATYRRTSRV